MVHMSANNHLCDHCRSFFDESLSPGNLILWFGSDGKIERWRESHSERRRESDWRDHWPTFLDFMKSASQGCHLCALFLLQVPPHKRLIFQALKSNYPLQSLCMRIQDAQRRAAGRYDLFLAHYVFGGLKKDRLTTMELQMQPTEGWHND